MRRLVQITLGVAAIAIATWLIMSKIRRQPAKTSAADTARAVQAASGSPVSTASSHGPINAQIDVNALSKSEIETEVNRRDAQDSKWEWKMPIRFYGRVVDENQQPVGDAKVHFQWTDLSGNGTTEADTATDQQGLFQVDNVQGKRLLVRVSKPGYYPSDPRNRLSFEFANPFEEIYYQPKSTAPVLFYLRKQRAGAELIAKSVEVVLPGDGTAATIRLETGSTAAAGELEVRAWKPWPPRPMSPPYDWKVTLALTNGGFVESVEELAFEAPESGYTPSFVIDMAANAKDNWKVSVAKTLYFSYGAPKRYGRLSLRTDGNSRYIFVDYVVNPLGSRKME